MNSHIIEQLYGVHVSGDQETLWEIRKELPILFKMLRRRIDKQFAELNAIDLTQFYADTPPVTDFENRKKIFLFYHLKKELRALTSGLQATLSLVAMVKLYKQVVSKT